MSKVLFCDIETTGLDSEVDRVLEVYGRVFDLDTLEAGAEFYWLTCDPPYMPNVDTYVQDMHHKNGLWQAILENPNRAFLGYSLEEFLREHMPEEYEAKKVVLAGRSVQFDRKFLTHFTGCWHHRVFDLRSIIEFWIANTDDKEVEQRFMTSAELAAHRAKQDVIKDILLYHDIAHFMRSAFSMSRD